ncbi:GNAT family N-acetyltransferase [Paenibacillus dendritiformis]|uniref:GNAT family N-acetyltransferase n=1 Tax=Paenibacillus dendritiformis TaxID=130049 RepID=UPI00105A6233|nr:GNAT family N-acetyltransferase [Paenibacillus dendritiformis]TDL47981.1 GNAT family N-acetyltransferase [Paenibacillus dendritiformis]
MFITFSSGDSVLHEPAFMRDEVQYHVLHRVCESGESLRMKLEDGRAVLGQTPGYPAWLWMDAGVSEAERILLLHALCRQLTGIELPGISSEPRLAEAFAREYASQRGLRQETRMVMRSYACPRVMAPGRPAGGMRKLSEDDIPTVARFLAAFSTEAYGTLVPPSSRRAAAEQTVRAGHLYGWMAGEKLVSMANITHRSARHARINAVYTPPEHRKQGFASGLVAELCRLILAEARIPVLYADAANPDSNRVYRNIGFMEHGIIADIHFVP